jgi:hypothetical protein
MVIREILLEGRRLHCIYCDNDKRPMGWGRGWADAVADPVAMRRLRWNFNIGVRTGRINGIVVVDIDPRNGGDRTFAEELSWLPPTRTHQSRSGGRHLIYRYPKAGIRTFSGSKGRLAGIDILSDEKGVLWPPSPGYTVIDDRPMAECPERLREMIAQAEKGASPSSPYGREGNTHSGAGVQKTRNVGARSQNILAVVMNAKAGDGRNKKLYWAARRFGELIAEGLVPRENAEIMLLSVARYCGTLAKRGLKQTNDTIASGLNHPIGGPESAGPIEGEGGCALVVQSTNAGGVNE